MLNNVIIWSIVIYIIASVVTCIVGYRMENESGKTNLGLKVVIVLGIVFVVMLIITTPF